MQARLFYDDLVVVDDYIPKHRAARREAFPNASFLGIDEYGLDQLADRANSEAKLIHPQIKGGDFANADFRALFELLQTHMVCTWDISSSVYHLNLKVLAKDHTEEFDKYGAVATAIFQELAEAGRAGTRVNSKAQLVDRFGDPIHVGYKVPDARWGDGTTGPPAGAIDAFVASLVWLANRAMFYTLASAHLKADTFLYPIRQAYQQHYLAKTFKYDANFPKRVVNQLSAVLSRDVAEVHAGGTPSVGAVDLPVFSAWFAQACGDPLAALHALEDVRMQKEFVEARVQLAELRSIYDDGKLLDGNKRVAKIVKGISRISTSMREKYSVKATQGVPLTRLVTIYNAVAAAKGLPTLPKIDLQVRLPQFLSDMKREVGFAAIYRNVMNDLATFGALGSLRDVLGRRVQIDEKAVAYRPKAEDPKYRRSHSPFKSPM